MLLATAIVDISLSFFAVLASLRETTSDGAGQADSLSYNCAWHATVCECYGAAEFAGAFENGAGFQVRDHGGALLSGKHEDTKNENVHHRGRGEERRFHAKTPRSKERTERGNRRNGDDERRG
jgi:hypothetical protein